MLDWLPGADPATRVDGDRFVKRALELFAKHVSVGQQDFVTIAVSEVDGVGVAVVYHVDPKRAERIAGRLRKIGVAASSTSGNDHAETMLHQREPKAQAIGISNSGGPCSAYAKYFENSPDGFVNLYWDSSGWLGP